MQTIQTKAGTMAAAAMIAVPENPPMSTRAKKNAEATQALFSQTYH
jgi:hypothetical protein